MRLAVVLYALAGCGRISFDGAGPAADAVPLTDTYGAAVLADGPAAYWRFEERTGTTVRDHIVGHVATLNGGCTLDAAGALTDPSLRAIELDGSTCRIVAGDILDLANTPFTIELWARVDVTNASVRWFLSHMDQVNGNAGYALLHVGPTLWAEQNSTGGGAVYIETTTPSLGTYHHIVYTFRSNLQRIYIDGALASEETIPYTQLDVNAPLVFGDLVEGNPNKFDGALDEIVFYSRELSPAEIAAHVASR